MAGNRPAGDGAKGLQRKHLAPVAGFRIRKGSPPVRSAMPRSLVRARPIALAALLLGAGLASSGPAGAQVLIYEGPYGAPPPRAYPAPPPPYPAAPRGYGMLGPAEVRAIVRGMGYRNVSAPRLAGRLYVLTAVDEEGPAVLRIDSLTGRVVSARSVYGGATIAAPSAPPPRYGAPPPGAGRSPPPQARVAPAPSAAPARSAPVASAPASPVPLPPERPAEATVAAVTPAPVIAPAAPQTAAPQTTAPQTTAPQATAPQATAPAAGATPQGAAPGGASATAPAGAPALPPAQGSAAPATGQGNAGAANAGKADATPASPAASPPAQAAVAPPPRKKAGAGTATTDNASAGSASVLSRPKTP